MHLRQAMAALIEHYPRVFFACHQKHVRDPATSTAVSSHQASVLDHLDEVQPTGVSELARHMGVTPSTMSLTLDRLQQRGYVVREADKRDARKTMLRLTPAGARLRDQQSVLDPGLVRSLLERLEPGERGRAIDGLAMLARAAAKLMKDRSESGAWAQRRADAKLERSRA